MDKSALERHARLEGTGRRHRRLRQLAAGLVQRCFIDGNTAKVSGDMNPDGQCFAAVPVSILVP